MKKYLLFLLAVFLFAILLVFESCDNTPPSIDEASNEPKKLSQPLNVYEQNGELFWDHVEGADRYIIEINGSEYETMSLYYVLPVNELFDLVKIKAVSDSEDCSDSDWTEYLYEQPTAALKYKLLPDGSGYSVRRAEYDLNKGLNGRIVIPDMYNGKPVKEIDDLAFAVSGLGVDHNVETGERCNTVTTSVRLPAYLETIGANAFAYCIALEEIKIPDGVKVIKSNAFLSCIKLSNVEFPAGVTKISSGVLCQTAISEFNIGKMVTAIESAAFNRTNLKSVVIPDSVEYIGDQAFAECKQLLTVTMPDNLKYIGSDVFMSSPIYDNCQNDFVTVRGNILIGYKGSAKEITIPENVKFIAGGVFLNNKEIVSVIIPDGIDILGMDLFSNSDVQRVYLGNGVKRIPENTFFRCEKLSELVLSDGTECIASGAICFCSSLQKFNLPSTLKEIESNAIDGMFSQIEEIVFSDNFTTIRQMAISRFANLKYVILPKALETFDVNAIVNCKNMKQIFYCGSDSDWKKVNVISNEIQAEPTYPVYFYSEAKPAGEGRYWHYVDGVPTVWGE